MAAPSTKLLTQSQEVAAAGQGCISTIQEGAHKLSSEIGTFFEKISQTIHHLGMELSSDRPDYSSKSYTTVKSMYGDDDLSSCPLFKGGYINFGYWKRVDISPSHQLTDDDRITSEQDLYLEVFKSAELGEEDVVLEVGSGLGFGCVLAAREKQVGKMVGLDLSADQLARAKKIHGDELEKFPQIGFLQGSAQDMPIPDQTFTKVISVEAAQHFPKVSEFLSESLRVLQPEGTLVITTFFATSESSLAQLKELIPTIRDDIDKVVSIKEISSQLTQLGFENIEYKSIGSQVWYGFDKWIAQSEMKDTWNVNWMKAYKGNLVDYYVIAAKKPAQTEILT